jgi:hypothetical protein
LDIEICLAGPCKLVLYDISSLSITTFPPRGSIPPKREHSPYGGAFKEGNIAFLGVNARKTGSIKENPSQANFNTCKFSLQ